MQVLRAHVPVCLSYQQDETQRYLFYNDMKQRNKQILTCESVNVWHFCSIYLNNYAWLKINCLIVNMNEKVESLNIYRFMEIEKTRSMDK